MQEKTVRITEFKFDNTQMYHKDATTSHCISLFNKKERHLLLLKDIDRKLSEYPLSNWYITFDKYIFNPNHKLMHDITVSTKYITASKVTTKDILDVIDAYKLTKVPLGIVVFKDGKSKKDTISTIVTTEEEGYIVYNNEVYRIEDDVIEKNFDFSPHFDDKQNKEIAEHVYFNRDQLFEKITDEDFEYFEQNSNPCNRVIRRYDYYIIYEYPEMEGGNEIYINIFYKSKGESEFRYITDDYNADDNYVSWCLKEIFDR